MSEKNILKNIVKEQFKNQDVQDLFEQSGLSEFDFKEKYLELIKLIYGDHPLPDMPIVFSLKALTFPLEFNIIDINIFKISVKVEQIEGGHMATVTTSASSFEVGKSILTFVDGTLERHERVGKDYLGAEYRVKIKLSPSFNIQLAANIWVDLPVIGNHKSSFGPKWLINPEN
ncbi:MULTISPECIES: hypothetical protein [unclassified Photorhabdus]|uniref:hypothetical protein n=1 Tax=unclassified Photorhabdus TaxID=2620880 RepID=UPI000DCAFDA0|nr:MULTISPECIES: hypothetical protein [unclassified Photorhabdus]RAW91788.1 hypothetical protein CKY03_23845 [Photorhabdus sp. S9-53]RAW91794.1 hypothetical protein CKY05_23810 [Photorhabdus sp. S10-54]RAW95345.1 hypothetical protein CKY04_23845 [Photorhabdus sp. S8-52]